MDKVFLTNVYIVKVASLFEVNLISAGVAEKEGLDTFLSCFANIGHSESRNCCGNRSALLIFKFFQNSISLASICSKYLKDMRHWR